MAKQTDANRAVIAEALRESRLEREFLNIWHVLGGPKLEREYRFAAPERAG